MNELRVLSRLFLSKVGLVFGFFLLLFFLRRKGAGWGSNTQAKAQMVLKLLWSREEVERSEAIQRPGDLLSAKCCLSPFTSRLRGKETNKVTSNLNKVLRFRKSICLSFSLPAGRPCVLRAF